MTAYYYFEKFVDYIAPLCEKTDFSVFAVAYIILYLLPLALTTYIEIYVEGKAKFKWGVVIFCLFTTFLVGLISYAEYFSKGEYFDFEVRAIFYPIGLYLAIIALYTGFFVSCKKIKTIKEMTFPREKVGYEAQADAVISGEEKLLPTNVPLRILTEKMNVKRERSDEKINYRRALTYVDELNKKQLSACDRAKLDEASLVVKRAYNTMLDDESRKSLCNAFSVIIKLSATYL